MPIEELLAFVAPPSDPIEAGPPLIWKSVEIALGIPLPLDFRDFGLRYGTGRFADPGKVHIQVLNPFSASFVEKVTRLCKIYRDLKATLGDKEVPYPVFPERPGLLPWGLDDNGNTMLWLTEGPPEQWPVILNPRNDIYERHMLPMTTFLARAFGRSLSCVLWDSAVFFVGPGQVVFEPTTQLHRVKRG